MNFLKNLFDDDSVIVGLCSFKQMKPKYYKKIEASPFFFNPYQFDDNFETDLKENVLL